ncbi:MAG: aquaporin [Actinomycetia bacterium]|nr:aquaporin [Actinomycetes bacterium]
MSRAAVLGEAIGAFALVFAGCGAVMVVAETGAFGAAGIAAAFGLVIGAMVYALGHVSGAHFNPAVTVTFALTRCSPWRQVPAYVAAQVVGALVAAGVLRFTLGDVASLGANTPSGSSAQSFAWRSC